MNKNQETNRINRGTPLQRWLAAGLAAGIGAAFWVLWLAEKGTIQLGYLFGVCRFKQVWGLPCPGCGWTHAAQAFVSGDVMRAFMIQPAAGFFCMMAIVVAILSLQAAVFGLHSWPLRMVLVPHLLKRLLWLSAAVVLLGWMVLLARAFAGKL